MFPGANLAILVLLWVLGFYAAANAANISAPGLHAKAVNAGGDISPYWPTDPVSCDLLLEGDVVDGDAKELERQFAAIKHLNQFTFFLCLRSDGGNVSEALKIARFVLDTNRPSIATVVEDGHRCASACALIFLAGTAPAPRGEWPQRFLHPRGRLQFHSSRLDLGKFKDDMQLLDFLRTSTFEGRGIKDKIVGLYRDGLRDEQSVISTFHRFTYQREDLGDPWVRPSLFLEMFAQDPSELICIDTIDAVGRWNIQVYGYDPPKTPTKRHYFNVCRNAHSWRSDQFVADAEGLEEENDKFEVKKPPLTVKLGGRNKASEDFDARFVVPFQAPMAQLSCVIEVKLDRMIRVSHMEHPATLLPSRRKHNAATDLTVFFIGGNGVQGVQAKLGPTSYFAASTLLPDLPGVHPPRIEFATPTSPGDFRTYPDSVMNGCSYRSLPNLDQPACQARCAGDTECKAYSYNKITRVCDLKHTLTARRFDPMWTTGEPSSGSTSERSSRKFQMKLRDLSNNGIRQDRRLDGPVIDTVKIEDVNGDMMCASNCESDRNCVAVESVGDLCQKFSAVNGSKEAPHVFGQGVSTFIKTQE